eukprot:scaffold78515_cov46-Attheya_sp.AAC.6
METEHWHKVKANTYSRAQPNSAGDPAIASSSPAPSPTVCHCIIGLLRKHLVRLYSMDGGGMVGMFVLTTWTVIGTGLAIWWPILAEALVHCTIACFFFKRGWGVIDKEPEEDDILL